MGKYFITIDAGTTNTRAYLLDEKKQIVCSASRQAGVRNTAIDGNNLVLKNAVRDAITEVTETAGISSDDVDRILASGMITSNVGLVEVPHITAPAGINELSAGTKPILLSDVCELPIWFVPGVKNNVRPVTLDNFDQMDIMRGEEVETIAILKDRTERRKRLIVLPGSHSKFIFVDEDDRIIGCLTSLTGELLDSVMNHTILSDAAGRQFVSEETYDPFMVKKGYDAGLAFGTGRACFSARILNQFVIEEKIQVANYLLGVILQNDIAALKGSRIADIDKSTEIIVSGKNPLRMALVDLLRHDGCFANIIEHTPDPEFPLAVAGACTIAEYL